MKPLLKFPSRNTQSRGLLAICLAAIAISLIGCVSPTGVDTVRPQAAYRQINASALAGSEPSDSSMVVLHRYYLKDEFKKNPRLALKRLHEQACQDDRKDILFALAELSHLTAYRLHPNLRKLYSPSQQPDVDYEDPRPYYMASAIYAYLYLFGARGTNQPPDPFARDFRLICDIYNRSLSSALALEPNSPQLRWQGGTYSLPDGKIDIKMDAKGFRWPIEWIEQALAADHYQLRGLTVRNRTSGLGAAVVLIPNYEKTKKELPVYMGKHLKPPATLFLRVQGDVVDMGTDRLTATLEVHSVADDHHIQVNGRSVPLETDLSVALAHSLEGSQVWNLDLRQFLSGEQQIPTGTYLLRPHQPGKIPVVFVHGTASNPAYWMEMFNTLLADETIRNRYQFWFFVYNTGNPILYSASLLRDSIRNLVQQFDPEQKDESLRQMVIIGHSQGGLLTRLVVSESGDLIWKGVSEKPFDEFDFSEKDRDLLKRALFFEPLPGVRRVVYVATPHNGSRLVGNIVERLTTKLVQFPTTIRDLSLSFGKLGDKSLPPEIRKGIPTSVSNMRPNSRFCKNLAAMQVSTNVQAHSIIAVKRYPFQVGNDGVVAYKSAHIEGVESELVVRSAHSCQSHPQVVEEVRRILLLHEKEMRK
jgi:pimeloyl-ACP methyl ester carboxylesterase